MLLPTVYHTVRINFLGAMPDDWGFNIASQLSWANLFYEVIQEALILPLFFILGKSLLNKQEFENKIRSGLLLTGIIYSGISLVLIIFTKEFVLIMAQDKSLLDDTVQYIRLETLAALFSTLFRFMFVVMLLIKKDKYLYIMLSVQMALSILLDTFLISGLSFSFKVGVNGIAISNIIVNLTILITCFFLLSKEQIYVFKNIKMSFTWVKEWLKLENILE